MVESLSPRLMRMPEVAAHLGVSRTTVYRLAERGQLPGVIRLGSTLRIDRRALEAWIDRTAVLLPVE
jgi:excisionase family DNA binding protein